MKKEPPISVGNLYILFNVLFQLLSLLPAGVAIIVCLVALHEATLPHAGAVLQLVGITYIFLEEVWLPTPDRMGHELSEDPTLQMLRNKPESATALARLEDVIQCTRKLHRVVKLGLEYILVAAGTFLNGFADWF